MALIKKHLKKVIFGAILCIMTLGFLNLFRADKES